MGGVEIVASRVVRGDSNYVFKFIALGHFWLPYLEFNKRTLNFGLLQPIFHASVHTREQDT